MKTHVVAEERRSVLFVLFVAIALTLAISSVALGDSEPVIIPPLEITPPSPLVQPPDTTASGSPQGTNSTATPYDTLLETLLVVLQVI